MPPGFRATYSRSRTLRPAVRSLATLVGVLVVYFALPVGRQSSVLVAVLSVLGLLTGIAVLAVLIVGQVRRVLRADADDSVRVQTLLVLLYVAVAMFALGYFILERSAGDQFSGLETKVDALYFTMTTLATVGFGDVHATGQVARALVTLQIVFNLVFVGTLVSMLTSQIRRVRERVQSG